MDSILNLHNIHLCNIHHVSMGKILVHTTSHCNHLSKCIIIVVYFQFRFLIYIFIVKEQKAAIYMKMVPTGIILKIIIHMNVSQKETFPLTILTMQEMNMQGLLELIFRLTIEIYYRECHAIFQLIVLLPLHQLNMLKTASIAETN